MHMRRIILSVACLTLLYFSTLSHKQHAVWEKNLLDTMCVLIFSITFVWNIYHSKKKWARYDQKCISVFMYSNRYVCQILVKLWLSSTDFLKIFRYQASWKYVKWEPSCPIRTEERADRPKDRHDEVIIRFWKFCERA